MLLSVLLVLAAPPPAPPAMGVCDVPRRTSERTLRVTGRLVVDLRHRRMLLRCEPGCDEGLLVTLEPGSPAERQLHAFERRMLSPPPRLSAETRAVIDGRLVCGAEGCTLRASNIQFEGAPPDGGTSTLSRR